ncbi:hypothetical protein [Pseudoalteromonas rubra]|nr:hypothetical protein [Pseudoalteromonas rubra]
MATCKSNAEQAYAPKKNGDVSYKMFHYREAPDENQFHLWATAAGQVGCDPDNGCNWEAYEVRLGFYRPDEYIETRTCPPEDDPRFTRLYVDVNGDERCGLPNVDENCPMPSESDQLTFSADKRSRCFENPDGTICKYNPSQNGSFLISDHYNGQEWTQCGNDGPDKTEPEEPFNLPKLDDVEKNGRNQTGAPEQNEGDGSESGLEIDALNKINKNLAAVIDNQNSGYENMYKMLENIHLDNDDQFRLVEQSNEYLFRIQRANEKTIDNTKLIVDELRDKSAEEAVISSLDATRGTLEAQLDGVISAVEMTGEDQSEMVSLLGEVVDGVDALVVGVEDANAAILGVGETVGTIKTIIDTDDNGGGQPCTGPDCEPCTGPDCDPEPCVGADCEPEPCTGPDCEPCTGDDCEPEPCTGPDCEPCTGDDCEPEPCTGPDCEPCDSPDCLPDFGVFDPAKSASFWESSYPDGLPGIWSEKSELLSNTPAISFLDKFKFNTSGGAPSSPNWCFNLGRNMNFGCVELVVISPPVLAFIRICILITAVFTCRRIIFGG